MGTGRLLCTLLVVVAVVGGACSSIDDTASSVVEATTSSVAASGEGAPTTQGDPERESEGDLTDELSELARLVDEFDSAVPELAGLLDFGDPNPLNVKYEVAEELRVSSLITSDGGTIAATDADGTTWTLTIPPGAVPSDVEISITPFVSVEGPRFPGGVQGVLLEPEGLVFLAPGEMLVSGLGADVATLAAAATFAEGANLHLTPSEVDGDTLIMSIGHFSSRLLTPGSWWKQIFEAYTPDGFEAGTLEAIDRVIAREDDGKISEADTSTAIDLLLKQWLLRSVIPKLNDATDNQTMDQAISEAISFIVTSQDQDPDGFDDRDAVIKALTRASWNHAYKVIWPCENDINAAARLLKYMWLADELIPAGKTLDAEGRMLVGGRRNIILDEGEESLEECLRFRVELFSLFEHDLYHAAASLSADVRLDETGEIGAVAFAIHEGWFMKVDQAAEACTYATEDGVAKVVVDFDLNTYVATAESRVQNPVVQIRFIDLPIDTLECTTTTTETNFWSSLWELAHGMPYSTFQLQVINQGDLFAVKDFMGPVANFPGVDGPPDETTQIQLIHTPGAP